MLIAASAVLILQLTGRCTPLFIIAGSAYILALVSLHALAPQLRPAFEVKPE
jgi:ACS family hexuronate transporter-like MFS transporter